MAQTLNQPDWFKNFVSTFERFFESADVKKIIDAYALDQESSASGPIHMGLLQLVTDVRFYMPVVLAQESVPPDANLHVYHFHEVYFHA